MANEIAAVIAHVVVGGSDEYCAYSTSNDAFRQLCDRAAVHIMMILRHPTEEMLEAGRRAGEDVGEIWQAMLDAI